MTSCAIVGVGMTEFGRLLDRSLRQLGAQAIRASLEDAALDIGEIDGAFVANTVGGLITGQGAIVGQIVCSEAGIGGIPVYNVENACAGSSTALNLAIHAIGAGAMDVALVVGVEKLYSMDRALTFRAVNAAADVDWVETTGVDISRESVFMREVYARRLAAYAAKRPLDARTLAQIAVKNRAHAVMNPNAQYRSPLTIDEVLSSREVQPPIRALMCAPVADGAAACIVVNADRAKGNKRAVSVLASRISMGSPPPRERTTVARVAERAYADAGIAPGDIDVAEVHDATAFGELLAYEDLGFCEEGAGSSLVAAGETSLGGKIPVNTSGGLESRGHPLAATGIAQIVELVTQLRREAGDRQVADVRLALAESAGGYVNGDSAAVAVTILGTTRREVTDGR